MSENSIDPNDLTSPGTVDDPDLEERRAREAAEREAESRTSSGTKFDEQREAVADQRSQAAHVVADVPEPRRDR